MKTIEEKAQEIYLTRIGVSAFTKKSYTNKQVAIIERESFKLGVEFAQRWISVSEEHPKQKSNGFSDKVLTKNSFENIHIERYDFECNRFTDVRYDALVEGDGQVSHWRPIELK